MSKAPPMIQACDAPCGSLYARKYDAKEPILGVTWSGEYIRNDPDAMREAGWVKDELLDMALSGWSKSQDNRHVLLDKLATARNDALEEAAVVCNGVSIAASKMADSSMAAAARICEENIRALKETTNE